MIVRKNYSDKNYPYEVLDSNYDMIKLDRWLLADNHEWIEFLTDLVEARKKFLKEFSKTSNELPKG